MGKFEDQRTRSLSYIGNFACNCRFCPAPSRRSTHNLRRECSSRGALARLQNRQFRHESLMSDRLLEGEKTRKTRSSLRTNPPVFYSSNSLLFRDGEPEGRTAALGTFYADTAAMKFYQVFNYGKPQARAAYFARPGLVYAVETLEDPG